MTHPDRSEERLAPVIPLRPKETLSGSSGRALGMTSTASGLAGFLGSWQVCHSLCGSAVAALSFFGLAGVGSPFLFLNRFQIYIWAVAAVLLAALVVLRRTRMRGISARMLVLNGGLIVAGTPLLKGTPQLIAYTIGALLVIGVIASYVASQFGFRRQASA